MYDNVKTNGLAARCCFLTPWAWDVTGLFAMLTLVDVVADVVMFYTINKAHKRYTQTYETLNSRDGGGVYQGCECSPTTAAPMLPCTAYVTPACLS